MIRACSRCASTRLRMPGFSDAVVPETDNLGEYVCDNGHKMTPYEFDDAVDFEAFRKGVGEGSD